MKPDIQKIILSFLNGSGVDFPNPADCQPVLKRIFDEQLQGIIYRGIKNQKIHFSAAGALENAYYASFVSNTYRIKAIEEMEPRLAKEKVSVLIVKGAALINRVYPDIGMRPMEDIDMIVLPPDLHAIETLLIQCGYARKPGFPLMFERGGVSIDLHTDLLHSDRIRSRKYLYPMNMDQLWARSRPWKQGVECIRRPDDADHFLFLAHHMVKHSFSKLIWLVDARQMIENSDDEFLSRLSRLSSGNRQGRPVEYVLYLLENIFALKFPQDLGFNVHRVHLTPMERAILNLRVQGSSMGDLGNILWLFCLPGLKECFYYGLETLFPKKEVLKREQSINPHWVGSIYAKRVLLLTRRLFFNIKIFISNRA